MEDLTQQTIGNYMDPFLRLLRTAVAGARVFAPGLVAAFLLAGATTETIRAQPHEVRSPDGRVVVTVQTGGDQLTYAVAYAGRPLITPSPISMTLAEGPVLGQRPAVRDTVRRRVDRVLRPVVPVKSATIDDRFNEMRIDFEKDFALVVRAYDDGAAYRFETARPDSLTIESEEVTFNLAGGSAFGTEAPSFYWARGEDRFITHSESSYQPALSADSVAGRMSTLPLVARYGAEGPRVALTEAGLEDYAGLFVVGSGEQPAGGGGAALRGVFAKAALAEAAEGEDERNTYPTRRAGYIARTAGTRPFPWRVALIAESDAAFLENQLVYTLAPELRLDETDWIEPGMVAWDWYNALNLYGVDFEAGLNTRTYKYYIDFAAQYGLDYVILDEGWYELGDLLTVSEEIDMEALAAYAEEQGVGLILWMVWKTLDRQMEAALDQFADWGVRGIKVDFMQRDDQDAVNFYWRTAREAAARQLLVDFHGSYKPTGLRRAYPNVITREGVKGLENNKWSRQVTPEHDVTLPFTRMVAGPMDYTPGAMVNAQPVNFAARFERPMSQGTRAHQLAMYVVYESPLQMLADSPSHYLRAPDVMDFLSSVPTVWDETRALQARAGDYVVVARRRGSAWYLGAMSDGEARTLEVDLSFLGEGQSYEMTAWADGPNAARYAEDYQVQTRSVAAGETLTIKMAPGGGFAARIADREE